MLCYQWSNIAYGVQVATEAVANRKNIIVTPDTYSEWLAGEVGVSATNSDEIDKAIMTLSQNRGLHHKWVKKRSMKFFDKTRPEKYIDKLLANVNDYLPLLGLHEQLPVDGTIGAPEQQDD